MKRITALRVGRGRSKRVSVFLDSKFAFSLGAEVVEREGLQIGGELSADEVETLARADGFHRCLDAAVHYLSYRPRSEAELRKRLHQRGFDGDSIEVTITKLQGQRLVDDMAFAQFWKDNREAFSPRSQWLTRLELRQKGVDNNIIDEVVASVDDNDSAYRAALGKVRSLPVSDYQDFCRRLGGYLKRRGFSYGVINYTVEQLWQEQGEEV